MRVHSAPWNGTELPFETAHAIATDVLARGDIRGLPEIFAISAGRGEFWRTDLGHPILTEMLALLLDEFNLGDAQAALAAMKDCPEDVAQQAHDLLLLALGSGGLPANPIELDDAAVLCAALLLGLAGKGWAIPDLIREASAGRTSHYFSIVAEEIVRRFSQGAEPEGFKPKLVIWDLDDTLWQGTLAEGDKPLLDRRRADFVRALNRHGIVSAICSKNDAKVARAALERFELWDEFVFPRIAFVPKGPAVKQIIEDMQLRPVNVLFVDDNPHNLREVVAAVPGIHVMDATSDACDALLQKVVDDHAHVSKSRVADYRLLETKVTERAQTELSDEAFLLQSEICATYTHRMDNLDFAERIEELINRSNQLNYTESRVEPHSLATLIMDVSDYDVFSAFVWDKYGHYGLVGTAIFHKPSRSLIHFAFSCRIMHMGVEDFLLRALEERYGQIDLSRLRKPLPSQSSAAITYRCFSNADVRSRILAEAAPRDWSQVRLRLMCECQSGAFHHYSRFRDHYDFDNLPRIFTLPMLLTGGREAQQFPEFLVYTPATDYMDWRWQEVMPIIDPAIYADCVERFCDFVVAGDHKALLFLPPEDASDGKYACIPTCTATELKERNRSFNALWRAAALRYGARIKCIDLTGLVAEADMMRHAYHYAPSVLQNMAGMIDDWYERTSHAFGAPPAREMATILN